jgi:hypothetical protein
MIGQTVIMAAYCFEHFMETPNQLQKPLPPRLMLKSLLLPQEALL